MHGGAPLRTSLRTRGAGASGKSAGVAHRAGWLRCIAPLRTRLWARHWCAAEFFQDGWDGRAAGQQSPVAEVSRLVMTARVSVRMSGSAWPGRLHEEQLLAEASTCWVLSSRVPGLPSLSTAVPGDSMPPALGQEATRINESEAAVLQLMWSSITWGPVTCSVAR
jgi:hypothetical protein